MRGWFWRVCLLLLTAATAVFASAQIGPRPAPPFDSIDLSARNCSQMVTGKVVDFSKDTRDWSHRPITIAIKEVLKGPKIESLTLHHYEADAELQRWKDDGTLLLITIPLDQNKEPVLLDLGKPDLAVMTANLKTLRKPEDVIREAKEEIARSQKDAKAGMFPLKIPARIVAGTPLDLRYDYGPREYVTVNLPIDSRLEALARKGVLSSSVDIRISSAEALGNFSDPANIRLLKSLLADQLWQDSYFDEGALRRHQQFNSVRRTAYKALSAFGVRVTEPQTVRPKPDEQIWAAEFDDGNVTETRIGDLARFTRLEDLYLSNARLSSDDYAKVGQVKSLRGLFLECSNASDADLKSLSRLDNLQYLALGGTHITDAGLPVLAEFKNLKKVDLGADVTAKGIAALRKLRPNLIVRPDEFAFLSPLHPRRVQLTMASTRNFFLPFGMHHDGEQGLRCYALVFPKESADKVEDTISHLLLHRDWSTGYMGYQRSNNPILGPWGKQNVDQVRFDEDYKQWNVQVQPNERMVLVIWNSNPFAANK